MSSNTALEHRTAVHRLAAGAALAGTLALGVAAPALAKPDGPGAGAGSSQPAPPSYNSSWPGYTPPRQADPAGPGAVTLGGDGIELAQVGLGALGGAALVAAGAAALNGVHRRSRAAHA